MNTCLGMGRGKSRVGGGRGEEMQEVGLPRAMRRLLGGMDMFIILIMVMVSGCIHLSKPINLNTLTMCDLLYVIPQ